MSMINHLDPKENGGQFNPSNITCRSTTIGMNRVKWSWWSPQQTHKKWLLNIKKYPWALRKWQTTLTTPALLEALVLSMCFATPQRQNRKKRATIHLDWWKQPKKDPNHGLSMIFPNTPDTKSVAFRSSEKRCRFLRLPVWDGGFWVDLQSSWSR